MPYEFYKTLHFAGILMTFLSLGALMFHAELGTGKSHPWRKSVVISHGLGLFLVLLAGFGMLAKLQIHWPWPLWVIVKFVIWLVLGGSVALFYKKPRANRYFWWGVFVLGVLAAYMATWKPI